MKYDLMYIQNWFLMSLSCLAILPLLQTMLEVCLFMDVK